VTVGETVATTGAEVTGVDDGSSSVDSITGCIVGTSIWVGNRVTKFTGLGVGRVNGLGVGRGSGLGVGRGSGLGVG